MEDFKVRCVRCNCWKRFIAGKTYDFIDGRLHGEDGFISFDSYKDIGDWNRKNLNTIFELVTEPKQMTQKEIETALGYEVEIVKD